MTMKLLAILGISAAIVFAAAAGEPGKIHKPAIQEEIRWHGWTPSGQVVEINNVYGDVRAENSNGDEIEVIALKHGTGDPADVSIEFVEHKGGVTVCAVYPNMNAEHPFDCRPSHGGGFRLATSNDDETHIRWDNGGGGDVKVRPLRVDFIVRVPKNLRFIGRTINGDVSACMLNQDVEAHSVSGNVTVSVDPSDGADLHAETLSGGVRSDFPVTVKNDREHGTVVTARVGRSRRIVRVKSASGNIQVLRGA